MARRNMLLRLRQTLLARHAELSMRVAGEFANLHDYRAADATGDNADMAFESADDEISAQLRDLEARELSQIGRALARLQQGDCGACECCQKPIPLARLNVLPYATLCIKCERDREPDFDGLQRPGAGDWAQLEDLEKRATDRGINLTEKEIGVSGNRWS